MNVLLLGSGGREHALAWKIKESPQVDHVYVLPGNDGMRLMGLECLGGSLDNYSFVLEKAKEYAVGLVVIGPEKPLAMGMADSLKEYRIPVVGPGQKAAKLESSKIFAKEFMEEFHLPTAPWKAFYNTKTACLAIDDWPSDSIVVKADALAGGKGVVVAKNKEEAKKAVFDFMENPACVVKTEGIVLEQCLKGREVSAFALCDGEDFQSLGYACDYKRVGDNDQGPNTGGMGCVGVTDWPSVEIRRFVEEKIFRQVILGMKKRKSPYKGILFAGLMIEGDEVKVIEFNVRLGDPEAQTLMPVVKNDLVPYLMACAETGLALLPPIELEKKSAVHVVMASKNYPAVDGTPLLTGGEIDYPRELLYSPTKNGPYLFFSGVKKSAQKLNNNGGRVLGLTALGENISHARQMAYHTLDKIHFEGAHYRSDIGKSF